MIPKKKWRRSLVPISRYRWHCSDCCRRQNKYREIFFLKKTPTSVHAKLTSYTITLGICFRRLHLFCSISVSITSSFSFFSRASASFVWSSSTFFRLLAVLSQYPLQPTQPSLAGLCLPVGVIAEILGRPFVGPPGHAARQHNAG